MDYADLLLALCPFPWVDLRSPAPPLDGVTVPTPAICRRVFGLGQCESFYRSMASVAESGARTCPYGFSVWLVQLPRSSIALSGIAAPNVSSDPDRTHKLGKAAPRSVLDAKEIESYIARLKTGIAELSPESSTLPSANEALHEVRRLNGMVKVITERLSSQKKNDRRAPDENIVRAWKASEMISLHLDALDVLANEALLQKTP